MRVAFEDGSVLEPKPSAVVRISTGEILIDPRGRVPSHLAKVWNEPPTYARVSNALAGRLAPGQWVLTAEGLKRIASVER